MGPSLPGYKHLTDSQKEREENTSLQGHLD